MYFSMQTPFLFAFCINGQVKTILNAVHCSSHEGDRSGVFASGGDVSILDGVSGVVVSGSPRDDLKKISPMERHSVLLSLYNYQNIVASYQGKH